MMVTLDARSRITTRGLKGPVILAYPVTWQKGCTLALRDSVLACDERCHEK